MSAEDDGVEISPVVRKFSIKMEEQQPENPIYQALGSKIRQHDQDTKSPDAQVQDWGTWLKIGEPTKDPSLKKLNAEREKLVKAWQAVLKKFPEKDRANLPTDLIPNIDTLSGAVDEAQQAWKSNRDGTLKERYSRFCEFADDHKYLLSIIPSGDKYVSLFTGVISSVVIVSVNYKKIADSFSTALADISSDLSFARKDASLWDSDLMRELVVDLYTEVFKFLCDALSWFMHRKTRIIGALSQRTKQDLNDKVVGIQKFVRRIKKEAKHLSQRDNKEKLDQILYLQTLTAGPDPLQHKLIGNETRQDNAEQNRQKRMNISERLGQRLGQCTLNTLHANEAAAGYQSLQMQPVEFVAVPIEDQDRRIEEIEDPSSSETGQDPNNEEQDPTDASSETDIEYSWKRYDVERCCREKAQFIYEDRESAANMLEDYARLHLPGEVLQELQLWIEAEESRMIWVEGPSAFDSDSILSATALRLCSISTDAGLPCISFFCGRPENDTESHSSEHEIVTISLLYSIILQLSSLLPMEFPPSDKFTFEDLKLLDGSIASAPTALKVIQGLLEHAPPTLIWIIDGITLAEDQTTLAALDRLLEILRNDQPNLSKVCFTTQGNSLVLIEAIDLSEHVDASRMAMARPGRVLAGGGSISALS